MQILGIYFLEDVKCKLQKVKKTKQNKKQSKMELLKLGAFSSKWLWKKLSFDEGRR